MRRSIPFTLVLVTLFAANAFAVGQARITGKIVDAVTKKPIENAVVKVTAAEGKTFNEQYKVKKDGTYAVFLLDGTLRYNFEWAAPGYRSYIEQKKKLNLGEPNVQDVALTPADAVVQGKEIKIDPSVSAYNDGAALANDGDDAGAIKKFEEAVAARPDLIAGWQALARVSLRAKNYTRAIEAANKANELNADENDMFVVLYDAYMATGNKAKAAEYKDKVPANAPALFNDAARAINAGKDAEAEPLLKEAISVDDKFAQAYYELGMLYVRSGKHADAKANLVKYLEIEPTGKDAATAKEMLKYVK